jgi:hypothetical protein
MGLHEQAGAAAGMVERYDSDMPKVDYLVEPAT